MPIGAAFLVKPGERIPLDGRVAGRHERREPGPDHRRERTGRRKSPGDEVFAGTINGDGALRIESTRAAADTTLARIIRLVGEAQSRRGPSEQWVEKFARVYTPTVMLLAPGNLPRAAARAGRRLARLVLPGAGAAGDRLPLCAW